MPKVVETSTLLKRGDTNRLVAPHDYNKCVSNCFGNYGKNGYNFNISRFGLKNVNEIHFRFKRNLDEPNLDIVHSLPKRRVVKKLIRIQPIYNQTLDLDNTNSHENTLAKNNLQLNSPHSENSLSSSEEDYSASSTASRKHYRKRVVIKKRRKKRPTKTIVRPVNTSTRRTVVVTKKRLLSTSISDITETPNTISTKSSYVVPASVTTSILPSTILPIDKYPIDLIVNPLQIEEFETITENDEAKSSTIDEHRTESANVSNKHVPDYEPFFPELSESLDAPILLLKTTVIASIDYETKTIVQSRLRTYTFVVTRVNANEQIVTSTTEVKPQTKTVTVTEPRTRLTTLTLLNLEATETLPFVPLTIASSSQDTTTHYTDTQEYDGRIFEEARYNLATRVMSNGVEVIVASDKSTLPGEPDIKRILPSSIYKPITLKPSTLSDHMMMMLPQDASNAESLSSSLYPNQFVTKTCLTTFTYLTTYLENGSTTISSHEQVVSNIATEERNSAKITATPSVGITLTQHPNLAVGTFLTTYTYLNTILDGEQPLVVSSKHTVTNTVTAPEDYLSLMQPPKKASAVTDTNTYYSTISLEKTLYEGEQSKVISTNEVVTQVVITESIPPKATSVMTSYIALDFEDNPHNSLNGYTTTDVVKTYYVTYTYFNTFLENGQTVVKTNVSTSSDIVTEKLFLHPKRTHSHTIINTSPIVDDNKIKINVVPENLRIQATKTYVTTFTYFTTLLQDNNKDSTSTIISSHTKEVENVVTETIDPTLLDEEYLKLLQSDLQKDTSTIIKLATLNNGQKLEITAFNKVKIEPTKVLPIEKTQMVSTTPTPPVIESSNPNVVTGSTIIFFDDDDQVAATKKPTPTLTSKSVKATKTATKNGLGSLLSSEIVKKSQVVSTRKQSSKSQSKRHTNKQTRVPVVGSKPSTAYQTAINAAASLKNKTSLTTEPAKKKVNTKVTKPTTDIPDLLGLGSINVNTLHALKPVINAMAGLITTNLKGNRRNDSLATTSSPKYEVTYKDNAKTTSKIPPAFDIQNRSPIYIPIGEQEDGLEIAESQNIATIHINEWEEDKPKPYKDQVVIGKPTHESPLLNGGIPISPGQVITANSDVIVGKPGRIGPRIPSIPLNKEHQDEVPIDMKPPPLHLKTWPKRHNEKFTDHVPNASTLKEKPDLGGKHDDYFGPPPPPLPPKVPLRPPNFVRGEKHKLVDRKRIPFPRPNQELNRIPINLQNLGSIPQDNNPPPQIILPNIAPVQIPLEVPTLILTKPVNEFNIQPSILNEPIVLPEVIERSTGQPLLVNLQPSQVAFVNIPHNRTTALIYGGSTEPHKNGQYFDDPSPYPEPEFSGIENFNNGVPQYASVYDDTQPPNQKQVGGVIKVGTDVINNNPPNIPSIIPSQIRPSRPVNRIPNNIIPQQNVNVQIPPISFGMVHHGSDFNAHIINHSGIKFSPPPTPLDVVANFENQNIINQGTVTLQQPNHIPIQQQIPIVHHEINGIVPNNLPQNKPINQVDNIRLSSNDERPVQASNIFEAHINHQYNKHRLRPKPNLNDGLREYLTPPQINSFTNNKPEIPINLEPAYTIDISPPPPPHPHISQHSQHLRPHIPINPEPNIAIPSLPAVPQIPINLNIKPELNLITPVTTFNNQPQSIAPPKKPLPIPLTPHNYNNVPIDITPPKQHEEEIVDYKQDDVANEAGEVTQESNDRPLRPGQLPMEILQATSTTKKPFFKNNTVSFADAHNVNFGIQVVGHDSKIPDYKKPNLQEPRPFEIRPFLRPENHQTNQINHHENSFFVDGTGYEPSRPFTRPNHHGIQDKFKDHVGFGNNQNIYEYSNKHQQYYVNNMENVNITFGQKIPNLSDPYYPAETNIFVNKDPHIHKIPNISTKQPSLKTSLRNEYITSTPSIPNQNSYEQVTASSVEIIPVRTKGGPIRTKVFKRPHITSMPVNPPQITQKPLVNVYEYTNNNYGSQTEKPFDSSLINHQIPSVASVNTTYNFNHNDVIATQSNPVFKDKFTTELDLVTPKVPQENAVLNYESPTPALKNITTYESDMEIMKPPPPPEPATSMQPPKIEVHSPGGGIHRVPNFNLKRPTYDLEGQASSPLPYIPQPAPPKTPTDEEVMGLSPPPPITTHRPVLRFTPNVTTHKPIFSLEIDSPKTTESRPLHPYTFEIPTTTFATTRRRRPFVRITKRPVTRKTTPATTSDTSATTDEPFVFTKKPTYSWQKPVTPINADIFVKNKTMSEITILETSETKHKESSVIPNSSTNNPIMEIIIGNPNVNANTEFTPHLSENIHRVAVPKNKWEDKIAGSEVALSENIQTTTATPTIRDVTTSVLSKIPTSISTKPIDVYGTSVVKTINPSIHHNFTTGIHHAGNEIKIVDDSLNTTTKRISSTNQPSVRTSIYKETKMIVPTRYITHTKTSTVTITKTTVIKTLGGPPSTMTILVTKTEKSTRVDTVTEIHTLVKPTSIVETVTTTINQVPTTLYPPDVPYGSTYSSYPPVLPTATLEPSVVSSTVPEITPQTITEDDLDEFIIHDTDAPPPKSNQNASIHVPSDNDSIFVVMTDQKHGEVISIPEQTENESYETQSRDELPPNNEVNRVLLGGILIASPPSLVTPDLAKPGQPDKCNPECKASKNELCQKVEGVMRCVCRPGFARMFPDRPCKPTYTYSIKIGLERYGKEKLKYEEALSNSNSVEFNQLASVTHEALDRMVMQSDLRDIYHGVHVHSYEPVLNDEGIINNFYLQLSDNTDEQRLNEILKKYLRSNNYRLGGTELYASKDLLNNLAAEDFDECANSQFHDCSEYAHCFNLPGTYTCSCKEGFSDLSENTLYPGRICSAELVGCEKCHYHGMCYSKGDDQIICECFQWYAGENCHINLKVLLIALVTLGTLLFALLLVCIILTCCRRKPRHAALANGMSFMPQRLANPNRSHTTLDRRAMIQDTSSEGSQSDTNTLPYVAKKPKRQPKGALKKATVSVDIENGNSGLAFPDQKDRSLTVMIPRAKYHPAPPISPHLNMETFDKRKQSAASSNETKLLSYLDAGPSPNKVDVKRKYSNSPSDSYGQDKAAPKKISGGALVSAGFEVSATVGGVMGTIGTIGTTCGTEADRSENATLIQKISADLLSSTGTRSQFTTFRKSLVDNDIADPLSNWLDITPKVTTTVSEARSYDETTIQLPTKSYRNDYDSKPSSQHPNDEANTMAERDVGSTFLLPHTHLYKPDRGSDISGFDSL